MILISGKPGSQIPPTRRHRCGICEHLSPNHDLSQALNAGLPAKLSCVQLRRRLSPLVGDGNILCEHLQAKRIPVRRFNQYLQVKWLKIAQFDLHFAQI